MVQNVGYLNGPPSHVTLPFEFRTPILYSEESVFRWLLLLNFDSFEFGLLFVKYSNHLNTGLVWDLNGQKLSGLQMVRYSNG